MLMTAYVSKDLVLNNITTVVEFRVFVESVPYKRLCVMSYSEIGKRIIGLMANQVGFEIVRQSTGEVLAYCYWH